MYDPGAQYHSQMLLTGSQFWRGRKTGVVPRGKPSSQVEIDRNSVHIQLQRWDGGNKKHMANLSSPGIQHRGTRIATHPDINPAQWDLTSVIKQKFVLSLGQAVLAGI